MQVREWLPYLAIVGALATGLQLNRNYVDRIREDAVSDTQEEIALAQVENKLVTLTETFEQAIESLKSTTWTDHQDAKTRLTANEARIDEINEKLHEHEKQRLRDEITRLKSGQ